MAQQMTRDELAVWADQHDKVLVPRDEYEELCGDAAASIAAQADIDRDYRALFGHTQPRPADPPHP